MIISKKKTESTMVKYNDEVSFDIRPFPYSHFRSESVIGSLAEQFSHCLVGWEGIKDEDTGEDFEFTPENKKFLFDYSESIRAFVINEAEKMTNDIENQLKN